MRTMVPVLITAALLVCPARVAGEPDAEVSAVVAAGSAYVRLLSDAERRRGVLRFDDRNRFEWTFLPGRRRGLTVRQLDEAKRKAALDLVRAGLSAKGWKKVEGVFSLETILRNNVSAASRRLRPDWRDPLGYTITVFGMPSMRGAWGWRIGGHHLSLSVTVKDGRRVSGTPFFFGANPARTRTGLEPLAMQESTARALVTTLPERQRDAAIVSSRVPRGFLAQPGVAASTVRAAGVAVTSLDKAGQQRFWAIVREFAQSLDAELADALLERARAGAPDRLRFVWQGSRVRGQDHYVRLHGETFVIEHWNQGNHIHSVWRDVRDEFGRASVRADD